MKFSELAAQIDTATEETAKLADLVASAKAAVDALKRQQADAVSVLESKVTEKVQAHRIAADHLHNLRDEMRGLLGVHVDKPAPGAGPTPAELKKLFLEGQNLRK